MLSGEGRADSIIGPAEAKSYFDFFSPEKARRLYERREAHPVGRRSRRRRAFRARQSHTHRRLRRSKNSGFALPFGSTIIGILLKGMPDENLSTRFHSQVRSGRRSHA